MSALSGLADLNALGMGAPIEAATKKDKLGQEQFLELMVAQLKNQDPMKPMENGEFLSQMAQFSTVESSMDTANAMQELSAAMMGNQALQAASLVGRTVLAPGSQGVLTTERPITGTIDLDQSVGNLTLQIQDRVGQTVRTVDLGMQSAGKVPFVWDGVGQDGNPLPPGTYKVYATGLVEGEQVAMQTSVDSLVTGVILGAGGSDITVELAGLGSRSLSDIKEIH